MAKLIDVSVFGGPALAKAFGKLPSNVQRKIFRTIARDVGKDIQNDAKGKVDVDEGKLKKSIKVRATKRSRTSVGIEVTTGSRAALDIPPEDEYYYPATIELGNSKVSPQSFLRYSLERNREKGTKKIAKAIMSAIKEFKVSGTVGGK